MAAAATQATIAHSVLVRAVASEFITVVSSRLTHHLLAYFQEANKPNLLRSLHRITLIGGQALNISRENREARGKRHHPKTPARVNNTDMKYFRWSL